MIIGQRIIEIWQNKDEIMKLKKISLLPYGCTYTMHNYEYAFIALTIIITRQLYRCYRNYKRVLSNYNNYLFSLLYSFLVRDSMFPMLPHTKPVAFPHCT